jgi:hypothetical protein
MWDKFVSQVKAYPWLFGGVAAAVLLWVFWPSGSSGGSDNSAALQAQAIAQNAAANAQLMLAHEETQRVGLQVSAAQAINAQNTAAGVKTAEIAANTYQYQADTAVELSKVQAAAQTDLTSFILESQESAQKWVADMEAQSGVIPGNFETYGFVNNAPSIVKVEPPPPPPVYQSPTPTSSIMPSYEGAGNDGSGSASGSGSGK